MSRSFRPASTNTNRITAELTRIELVRGFLEEVTFPRPE